jgi:signal transduction histidine kinase
VEIFTFGLFGMLEVIALIASTASWNDPFTNGNTGGPVNTVLIVLFIVAIVAVPLTILTSFASTVVRFKGSTGDERLQLKWFATAAGLTAITFAISVPFGGDSPVFSILTDVGLAFLYVAIARAILKYRLYEIDVVIGKTVVFATLVVFITIVYIGLVVGIGALVGNQRSPLLSALAAALVAIAFQPVRLRARRFANRLVYGRRATPYEVLTDFTARASETYSTEDVLPRMARILADGVGATQARVWLRVGSELRPAASWPSNGSVKPVPIPDAERFTFPDRERAFPVRYAGELLGAISVITPPDEPLAADREQLLSDVAAQAALVLRNVRLIEELRESRRRIVTAQDERAKALERNLHDGAQQQLVALAVKQRLAETLVDRDPEKAKAMLADIQTETQEALETLRDLARGIYPPLLADKGLAAALERAGAQGGRAGAGSGRRCRPLPAGAGSGRLLLLSGGTAERGEVRQREPRRRPPLRGWRPAAVRGRGRRFRFRPGRHAARHGSAGDGRPSGRRARLVRGAERARARDHRGRPRPDPHMRSPAPREGGRSGPDAWKRFSSAAGGSGPVRRRPGSWSSSRGRCSWLGRIHRRGSIRRRSRR